MDYGATDLCPTFISFRNKSLGKTKFVKNTFRLQSEPYLNHFRNRLNATEWNFDQYNDVKSRMCYFNNTLNTMFLECFPLKTKYISMKRIEKPWLTSGIMESIKTKSYYFSLYRRGFISKEINNRYKNKLNKIIKRAKNTYYSRFFEENKRNLKKTWQGKGN